MVKSKHHLPEDTWTLNVLGMVLPLERMEKDEILHRMFTKQDGLRKLTAFLMTEFPHLNMHKIVCVTFIINNSCDISCYFVASIHNSIYTKRCFENSTTRDWTVRNGGHSDCFLTDFLLSALSILLVISVSCSRIFLFINNNVFLESAWLCRFISASA